MRLLLVSGGTGGHITPALAVLYEARRRGLDAKLILGGLKVNKWTEEADLIYKAAEVKPKNLLLITSGIFQTFRCVLKSDVVLSFGGYPILPPLLNATLLGKPKVLFEGDALPGRANRFFSCVSSKVLCAFKRALKYYRRSVFVGIPVKSSLRRLDKYMAREFLGIPQNRRVVGVLGGSQGSMFLNSLAEELASEDFFVLALVGRRGKPSEGKNHLFLEFIKDMSYFYSSLDLLISRAGMATIGEIAFYRIPTLFIPYPFAGGHQVHNALDVVEHGAALMIRQEEANLTSVKEALRTLMDRSDEISKKLAEYSTPDAPVKILEETLGI